MISQMIPAGPCPRAAPDRQKLPSGPRAPALPPYVHEEGRRVRDAPGRQAWSPDRSRPEWCGAIVGGDAGRHAGARVDRLTEGSAELRSIFRGHGTDVEMFEALFSHRQAYQAASELGHEVDSLGRDLLGGQGEVAFVFAVFVVDHNVMRPARISSIASGMSVNGDCGVILSRF